MANVNIEWNYVKDKNPKAHRDYLIATGNKIATFGYYEGHGAWYEYTPTTEDGEEWKPCTPYAWAELPETPAR